MSNLRFVTAYVALHDAFFFCDVCSALNKYPVLTFNHEHFEKTERALKCFSCGKEYRVMLKAMLLEEVKP